jgi:hypothetical protein
MYNMTKLYVISKSDLKKLGKSNVASNRSLATLDGEELDLDKLANANLSSNRSFAVLDRAELDSGERVKHTSRYSSVFLNFAMMYLGLFIGFLIALIAVDMPFRKHVVFIIGTLLFGVIFLVLFIWWWTITYRDVPHKKIQESPTYDDTLQWD